jgi:hypothetical protein
MQENAEVVALSPSFNRVFRFNTYWKGVNKAFLDVLAAELTSS